MFLNPSVTGPVSTIAPTEQPVNDLQTIPPNITDTSRTSTTSQPTPSHTSLSGKSEKEIQDVVLNVAESAKKYYESYRETNEFVSKNGYLFENPADMYVTTDLLTGIEGFKIESAQESVLILYVRAGDLPAELRTRTSTGPSEKTDNNTVPADELTVAAAYQFDGGYSLAYDGKMVSVSVADMNLMLKKYDLNHGAISIVHSTDELFTRVSNALEEDIGSPLDIRYMFADDKYVSSVVSPQDNPLLIREYILQRTNAKCEIAVSKIETFWQKFADINKVLPDLNLDLVPEYNLWRELKDVKSDFSGILKSFRDSGIISQEDVEPLFISGNNEFVFVELGNKSRLLAHSDGDPLEWKVYFVTSYDNAITRMKEIAKFNPPPYFLIKQS
jgi:hypothetical protein